MIQVQSDSRHLDLFPGSEIKFNLLICIGISLQNLPCKISVNLGLWLAFDDFI